MELVQQPLLTLDPAPIELTLPLGLRSFQQEAIVSDDLWLPLTRSSTMSLIAPPPSLPNPAGCAAT